MNLIYTFEKEEINNDDTFTICFREDDDKRSSFHLDIELNLLLLKGDFNGKALYFTIDGEVFRKREERSFTRLIEKVVYNKCLK